MISKELFLETIEFIKTKRGQEDQLCAALDLCSPQEPVNAFIYSEYETQCIKLLHDALELSEESEILEWWCWETQYGENFKPGDYEDEGVEVDLSTAEKLYDYIAEQYIKTRYVISESDILAEYNSTATGYTTSAAAISPNDYTFTYTTEKTDSNIK